MTRIKSWRWSLVAVLMGASIGCQPATSTKATSSTPKATNKQPDKKDEPVKVPKPDVG